MTQIKMLIGLVLILLNSVCFAADTQVIVQARLIEIPGTMPPNELYNYVYVMKYKVEKVIEGKLEVQEILVGQYNPLMSRSQLAGPLKDKVSGDVDKFKVGAKQTLTLVSLEKNWDGAVEDEFFDDEDSIRWLAIKSMKLP